MQFQINCDRIKKLFIKQRNERKSKVCKMLAKSNKFFRRGEKNMREGIHPNYYQAKVVCNCGNEFVTGSTKEDIHVEICSKCHSFYTGQQKATQARGRIDKFNRKYGVK